MALTLTEVLKIILLIILILCSISVNFTRTMLQAVIVFMAYSSVMSILWILMESPDLAITEAAVGAGVSTTLFLVTLRRIRAEDLAETEEEPDEGGSVNE